MKIAILLPYKEDYTPKYSGAVSIHVSNLIKYSKFKNTTTVFGNTKKKNYLSDNFFNVFFHYHQPFQLALNFFSASHQEL